MRISLKYSKNQLWLTIYNFVQCASKALKSPSEPDEDQQAEAEQENEERREEEKETRESSRDWKERRWKRVSDRVQGTSTTSPLEVALD